ncbi:hypothetical protein VTL71DRAFT_4275 [Oculimacula yallundae]|uniref:Uncharacterized protein n=1 Tax=Oculimacula yallundae TaxID=86028 RepID=A0ABR4C780_9HELO
MPGIDLTLDIFFEKKGDKLPPL